MSYAKISRLEADLDQLLGALDADARELHGESLPVETGEDEVDLAFPEAPGRIDSGYARPR